MRGEAVAQSMDTSSFNQPGSFFCLSMTASLTRNPKAYIVVSRAWCFRFAGDRSNALTSFLFSSMGIFFERVLGGMENSSRCDQDSSGNTSSDHKKGHCSSTRRVVFPGYYRVNNLVFDRWTALLPGDHDKMQALQPNGDKPPWFLEQVFADKDNFRNYTGSLMPW
jgi:hypothetical protein